jgi:hypothetical protein
MDLAGGLAEAPGLPVALSMIYYVSPDVVPISLLLVVLTQLLFQS